MAIPSVSSKRPSDSTWFYIDLNEQYYKSQQYDPPLYEISTTEEFGPTRSDRNSRSNCEIEYRSNLESFESFTRDTYCILDLMEHDLFLHAVSLKYNIPEGMCHSVVVRPPWHFNYPVGEGPLVTSCDRIIRKEVENADGELEITEINKQEFCVNTCDNSTCSEKEDDLCEFNHKVRKAGGETEIVPCCFGIKNAEGDLWGGDLKKCIGGAGRTSWNEVGHDPFGRPTDLIELSSEDGYSNTFEIKNIHDATGGLAVSSTPVANYVKDLDVPAEDAPRAYDRLNRKDGPLKEGLFKPYPFFTVECLDATKDTVHALHLMIREWNTYEQFYAYYQSGGSQSNNPDVDGEEGGGGGNDCDYEENRFSSKFRGTAPCNDYKDLDDYYDEGQIYPAIPYQ